MPGLSGPDGDDADARGLPAAAGRRVPALRALLAAATPAPVPVAGVEATLLYLMGLPESQARRAGGAPFSRLGEDAGSQGPAGEWWMRADPVHLQVDLDRLVLGDGDALAVTDPEAAELVTLLNERLFRPDGMELGACTAKRWYLRLPGDPGVWAEPPGALAGCDVARRLARGPGARAWRARLNEAQMLLHESPVNAARAGHGQPAINSLWLWGAAPTAALPRRWARVYGGGVLGRGLARASGALWQPVSPPPAVVLQTAERESTLVLLDALHAPARAHDLAGWRTALAALERDWFAPLRRPLRSGARAALYAGDGSGWMLRAPPRWRWIRRASRRG